MRRLDSERQPGATWRSCAGNRFCDGFRSTAHPRPPTAHQPHSATRYWFSTTEYGQTTLRHVICYLGNDQNLLSRCRLLVSDMPGCRLHIGYLGEADQVPNLSLSAVDRRVRLMCGLFSQHSPLAGEVPPSLPDGGVLGSLGFRRLLGWFCASLWKTLRPGKGG